MVATSTLMTYFKFYWNVLRHTRAFPSPTYRDHLRRRVAVNIFLKPHNSSLFCLYHQYGCPSTWSKPQIPCKTDIVITVQLWWSSNHQLRLTWQLNTVMQIQLILSQPCHFQVALWFDLDPSQRYEVVHKYGPSNGWWLWTCDAFDTFH